MEANKKIDLGVIAKQGYSLISGIPQNEVKFHLSYLGSVLMETEIMERTTSSRLLASSKSMALHTDHYKADYVVWYCIKQADEGGESLLLDTYGMMEFVFSPNQLTELRKIRVFSHKVFPQDSLHYPLLSEKAGCKLKVFYSPWMVSDAATSQGKLALADWKQTIETIEPIKILLKPNDLLIIDNGRMLHGRAAFNKNSDRLLHRLWIKETFQNNNNQ